jgi:uncharacterized protein (TIGR00297 family)
VDWVFGREGCNVDLIRLAIGFPVSVAIAGLGYWHRSLTISGLEGTILIGTSTVGLGGWGWAILVMGFFSTSTLLSRYGTTQKRAIALEFQKGERRDGGQVLANGGLAALLAVAYGLWSYPVFWAAFVGGLAAVNADTWATELGLLSRAMPRMITTGKPAVPGASGAVSWPGMVASLAGAATIGLLAAAVIFSENCFPLLGVPLKWEPVVWIPVGLISGTAASLVDSVLGATLQCMYHCDACGVETERSRHCCGYAARRVRGLPRLDNNGVNFLSSVVGGAMATALVRLFC